MQNVDNTVLAGVMSPNAGDQRSVAPTVRDSPTEDAASTVSAVTSSTARTFGVTKQRPADGPNVGTRMSSISEATESSQVQPPDQSGVMDLGVEQRNLQ